MAWATEGVIDYPVARAIMADTGAITLGMSASFTVLIWSEFDGDFDVAVRNANNNGDVKSQRVNSNTYVLGPLPLVIGANERVVVRAVSDMTGASQATILW